MLPMGEQTTQPDPNDSDEWEKIRRWVGASEGRSRKDPVEDALRMDEGGVVPDSFDVSGGDSETMKLRGTPPSIPPALQAAIPPTVSEMPSPPRPSLTVAAPETPPTAAPAAVPENFEAEADRILGSSPDARKALFSHLQKADMWAQLPALLAGFGDSVARGYGHDAGANHMGDLEKSLSDQDTAALKNADDVASFGKQRFGLTKELEADSAASPYSKMVQNAYRGMLKTMGATDAEISSMPAAVVSDIAQKRVTLTDALERLRLENTWKSAELANTKASIENAAASGRRDAAKEVAKGSVIPFVGPSHKEKVAAREELARQATGQDGTEAPVAVNSHAEYATLKPGTLYRDSNGKVARKK